MGRTAKQRGPLPPSMPSILASLVLARPELTAEEIADVCGVSSRSVARMAEVVSALDLTAVSTLKVREPDLQTVLGTAMALKSLELIDSDPRGAVSLAFGAKLSAETRKTLTPEQTSRPGGMVAFIEHLDNRQVVIQGQALKPLSLDTGLSLGGGDEVIQALTVGMSDNDHYVMAEPQPIATADSMTPTGGGGVARGQGELLERRDDAEIIAEE